MPPLPGRGKPVGGKLPVAKFIPQAVPLPSNQPYPLTNIGGTPPSPQSFIEPAIELIPLAREPEYEGEQEYVTPDPNWIIRWQNSATPMRQVRPWVRAYRWWLADIRYMSWGPDPLYRIDLWFQRKGHQHKRAYAQIPKSLWLEFRMEMGSIGQFFWKHFLGDGYRKGQGSKFPDWEIP